jgi:nucleotide-binding universal stress UspA family protein
MADVAGLGTAAATLTREEPMYRRISVPIDDSIESEQALSLATTIARRADCPIDLVHIVVPPVAGSELYGAAVLRESDVHAMRVDATARLEQLARTISESGVRATPVLHDGTVPQRLAEHFRESGTDLVVMTTHDRNRLEHLLLGSISGWVVRRVHVPVLLVHARPHEPASAQPARIAHVLVPLDGSAFGEEVLPHAAAMAELMGARLTLLTVALPVDADVSVVVPPVVGALAFATPVPGPGGAGMSPEALERVADRLRGQRLDVRATVVTDEQPARAIAAHAAAHDVDLIAMTTHGRGAFGD